MKEIEEFCRDIRKNFKPRIKNSKEPVKYWSEPDILNNKPSKAFVIIFRTRGCSWHLKSGCSMCGYFNDSLLKNQNQNDIIKQYEKAMERYNGEKIIKIFNSGSFFDNKEINSENRKKIIKDLANKSEKISVESRPEYITNKNLKEIYNIVKEKNFEIGIGLETVNDIIRNQSINKGFNFDQYLKAVNIMKKYDFKIKTYLLLKPPFLTEEKSIIDNIESVKKIQNITDMISLNPTNIQSNTFVEYLWKSDRYSPPWLWSILKVLIESKKIIGDKVIKCDVVGGGSFRGPHNCGKCDNDILNNISKFSQIQNIDIFENDKCDCYETWLDQLEIEKFCFNSQINNR